jgi:exodeoxyribonuclease-3
VTAVRVATFNVNSLRAREARVLAWLERTRPDVVLLQELKLEDDKFPDVVFRGAGYGAAVYGQKTYNGVAILSRHPLAEVSRGFGDGVVDPQARFVCARTAGLLVASVYVPNGESVGSDKYRYKLAFFERLAAWARPRVAAGEPLVIGGDYNVAPGDLDAHDPYAWRGRLLFSDEERAAFAELRATGLHDVVRERNPGAKLYTWWDYRLGAFAKDRGLRIDHLLAASAVAARATAAGVDRDERDDRGPRPPSDHAPAWIEIAA